MPKFKAKHAPITVSARPAPTWTLRQPSYQFALFRPELCGKSWIESEFETSAETFSTRDAALKAGEERRSALAASINGK